MRIRIISFVYILLLCATQGWGQENSGKLTPTATWHLEDSVLTISGTGDVPTDALSLIDPARRSYPDNTTWAIIAAETLASPSYQLKSIEIEDGITHINSWAFVNCHNLTSIKIPKSVKSIGDYAFANCPILTSLHIPVGVKKIGEGAFAGCSSLASVIIPESVKSIGNYAFSGCATLELNSKGVAFYIIDTSSSCNNPISIEMKSVIPPKLKGRWSFDNSSKTTFILPAGAKTAYKKAKVWKNFMNIEEQ